jgi:hypothetical protein
MRNAKTPKEDVHYQLIEDTKVLCKNDKLPLSFRRGAAKSTTQGGISDLLLYVTFDCAVSMAS